MKHPNIPTGYGHRILKIDEVMAITGLRKTSIYDKIAKDEFPKQIRLSVRSVGWIELEIQQWIDKRITDSRSPILDKTEVEDVK